VKCPKCSFENREGAKFCNECGHQFELTCPECGTTNQLGSKFCDECGHDLGETKASPSLDYSKPKSYTPKHLADKILTTRSSIEGERKLVTVLFADVANYTSISEKLDPEEVHQIMDGCFKILIEEIHKFEGTINQFTGDGVMALFGAPVSHEDHAYRACHVALAIQRAMTDYGEKIRQETDSPFHMRIGINSGPVIVGAIGDDLRMDYTAVGDTTNLAARIQQSAKPGEVWISRATERIVSGYFQIEPEGDLDLKGKTEPQRLYHIIAEQRGVQTRFEAGLARGITELVGRRPEMEILHTAWERAKSGEGRVVDVVGEAGVGKSRLIYEFQKAIAGEATILTGVCIQYGRGINFLPVIDVVRGAFGIKEGMSEEEAGGRVYDEATGELAAMIPFYRNLLSLKVDDPKFNALNPEGRKFGSLEAVKILLLAMSNERPLIVFLEDVHWIDKISEDFFSFFTHSIHGRPIMLLTAYRPEAEPPWTKGAHYRQVGLETLSAESSIRLVRNILGGLELESSLEEKIAQKTGGNPFFVEEMVRELIDRGDVFKEGGRYISRQPIDQLEIPSSVQGVLAARMDRLSEDLKGTMQVASVIGRDFAYKILRSIMELGDELRIHLTNLVGLEILYEKVLYPEIEYIFKHALTQEVAYESLLKQRRREIHGRIASTIEELYAGRLDEHLEVLAHHYDQSGNSEKAFEYLMLAGEKSNRHFAVQAACQFFTKAIEVIESTPITLDSEKEVRLHQGLADASYATGDIKAALEEFRKTVEICRIHGMIEHEMDNLGELAMVMWLSPIKVMKDEAIRCHEEGIARAREVGDKAAESRILSVQGFYKSTLGHRYQGNHIIADAERMALETGNQKAILFNRLLYAGSERWLGRPQKAIELTEGLIEAMRGMFNYRNITGVIFLRGIALGEVGQIEDGIAILRDGIDICEKSGAVQHLGRLYNSLGYCYGEICNSKMAWGNNLKSEESARELMDLFPMGRETAAEVAAQASVNLMENLFYQGKLDAAWERMKSLDEESKSDDFIRARDRWKVRMDYLTAQILLHNNDMDQAHAMIEKNLEITQREHSKKMEGGFMRVLGEVQFRRNEIDNAIDNLNEAVLILKEVGNPRQLWQAHSSLASAFSNLGRASEAKKQWGAAGEVIHKTASGLSDRELRDGFLRADPIREILSKAES